MHWLVDANFTGNLAYSMVYGPLYHATENTANQNTGKPLYIRVLRSFLLHGIK